MFAGGIADKLGNRYEAKWLIRQFLEVIAGHAQWLRFEGIESDFGGFEFAVGRGDIVGWHQTKMNSPSGNWTIPALDRENVLAAFKRKLEASVDSVCVFVSQDPAKDLSLLAEKAKVANTADEFIKTLGSGHREHFDQLIAKWDVDNETGFGFLNRCESRTIPQVEIETTIDTYSDFYFANTSQVVFAQLREFLETRFNKKITTESGRADIRAEKKLELKDWSLDPTLRERLIIETQAYLDTYSPVGVGGQEIPRRETSNIIDLISNLDGPTVILVTGIAGSGKSGVVRGVIEQLKILDIPCLALRIDHHLDCTSNVALGKAVTGREESPATTIKGIEPNKTSVLIIDQVDAVSEISGRNGAVKEAVLRLIGDARNYRTVRLVFVCRSFDLDSDPRLRTLKDRLGVTSVDVPLLDWSEHGNYPPPFSARRSGRGS
jgi:hypothetical protein